MFLILKYAVTSVNLFRCQEVAVMLLSIPDIRVRMARKESRVAREWREGLREGLRSSIQWQKKTRSVQSYVVLMLGHRRRRWPNIKTT